MAQHGNRPVGQPHVLETIPGEAIEQPKAQRILFVVFVRQSLADMFGIYGCGIFSFSIIVESLVVGIISFTGGIYRAIGIHLPVFSSFINGIL